MGSEMCIRDRHRIGRTGRAGRSGAAFTIVTKADVKYADAIEKLIGQKIEWLNGDLSSLPAPMESTDSRPRKGREGKERESGKRRGDRRGRVEKDVETPMIEAVETVAAQPEVREPVRQQTERHQHQPAARQQRPYPANDDGRRDRRHRHRDHDDGPTPVGFGDDIPAFMLIAGLAKA